MPVLSSGDTESYHLAFSLCPKWCSLRTLWEISMSALCSQGNSATATGASHWWVNKGKMLSAPTNLGQTSFYCRFFPLVRLNRRQLSWLTYRPYGHRITHASNWTRNIQKKNVICLQFSSVSTPSRMQWSYFKIIKMLPIICLVERRRLDSISTPRLSLSAKQLIFQHFKRLPTSCQAALSLLR